MIEVGKNACRADGERQKLHTPDWLYFYFELDDLHNSDFFYFFLFFFSICFSWEAQTMTLNLL